MVLQTKGRGMKKIFYIVMFVLLFSAPAFAARYTGDPPDDALYWAFIMAIVVGIMALIIHYVRKLCSKINTFVVKVAHMGNLSRLASATTWMV